MNDQTTRMGGDLDQRPVLDKVVEQIELEERYLHLQGSARALLQRIDGTAHVPGECEAPHFTDEQALEMRDKMLRMLRQDIVQTMSCDFQTVALAAHRAFYAIFNTNADRALASHRSVVKRAMVSARDLVSGWVPKDGNTARADRQRG